MNRLPAPSPCLAKGPRAAQAGAALMVSLIMLLLITLVAVAATRSQSLETRMAVNLQNRNIATDMGEAALRNGESALTQGVLPSDLSGLGDTGGTYVAADANVTCTWGTGSSPWYEVTTTCNVWNTAGKTLSYGTYSAPALSSMTSATTPQYIIEQLPSVAVAGTSISTQEGGNGYRPFLYRLTAFANGGDSTSSAMVQSVFIH